MINIKEKNGKIRVGFKEKFKFDSKDEAKELMNKLLDMKEQYSKGIIAERISEKI